MVYSEQTAHQVGLEEAKAAAVSDDDLASARGIIACFVLAMLFWVCIGLLTWCAIG